MTRDPLAPSNRSPSVTNDVAPSPTDADLSPSVGSKDDLRSELRPERPGRSPIPSPNDPDFDPSKSASADIGAVTQMVADLSKRMDSLEQTVNRLVDTQHDSQPASGAQAEQHGPELMGSIAHVAYRELGQVMIPSASPEFGHQKLARGSELGRAVEALLREGGFVTLTGVKEA